MPVYVMPLLVFVSMGAVAGLLVLAVQSDGRIEAGVYTVLAFGGVMLFTTAVLT